MSDDKRDDLTPRLMEIFTELNRLSNWYENNAKLILSIPLFINAGAAIALASFFSNNGSPPPTIKYASIAFILGTIFGVFTLVFEYLASFFSVSTFNNYMFKNIEVGKFLEESLKRYESYNSGRDKRIMKTIKIRIMNGAFSIIFCFLGIFFIARYIVGGYCPTITLSVILFFYFIAIIGWIYQILNPK